MTDAEGKAELFLDTFTAKYELPPPVVNHFSQMETTARERTSDFCLVRSRAAEKVLKNLKEDKATGPDQLAALLLKKCAKELSLPVAKLARAMLAAGKWPTLWRTHWVMPLYKKRSVYNAENYRGIHLSSQLSKAVERLLGHLSW